MKTFLLALTLFLTVATAAHAQCFRLVGCGGPWPEVSPILAHQANGDTVLLAAILPEWSESVVVYWGDRGRSEYFKPLPVIFSHRYLRTGATYKIRLKVLKSDGSAETYTHNNVVID